MEKTFESFLGLGKDRKHDDVVRKITKYVIDNNVISQTEGAKYVFFIGDSNIDQKDPFGEEVDKENRLKVSVDYEDYEIRINGDTLDCSSSLAKKLLNILRANKRNAEIIKRDQRIKDNLNKVSYFKKEK